MTRPKTKLLKEISFIRGLLFLLCFIGVSSCSLTETRPVQDMADTVSALKAAKEVNADSLAPELFRQAVDAYTRSKNEYRYKNFSLAKAYALRAKKFAEEAEYQSILQGANRTSLVPTDEPPPPPPPPEEPPPEQGTPIFLRDEAAAAAAAQQQQQQQPPAGAAGNPSTGGQTPPTQPGGAEPAAGTPPPVGTPR